MTKERSLNGYTPNKLLIYLYVDVHLTIFIHMKKRNNPIKINEKMLSRIIREAVDEVVNDNGFEEIFEKAREEFMSRRHNGMFGFELKNPEGDYQYDNLHYNPKTNELSCLGVSIQADPDFSFDQNLEALYEELMNQGYGDE